jgi:homoserine/homoserine lactone efflux protein
MTFETWLLFCAIETVLCFTPGPAVLLVVSTALTRSARAGIAASFGILAANAAYFALSATSLGAILLASWELFSIVKWAGAAYLVWVGCRMLVSALARRDDPPVSTIAVAPQGRLGSFGRGLITQGSNPKSLVFFSAILPQFIDTAEPLLWQIAVLGVS